MATTNNRVAIAARNRQLYDVCSCCYCYYCCAYRPQHCAAQRHRRHLRAPIPSRTESRMGHAASHGAETLFSSIATLCAFVLLSFW